MPENNKPAPVAPRGNTSFFTGISENFAFHASPEAFLAHRIGEQYQNAASDADARPPIHVPLLNRNVVIVSAYRHIKEVLDANDSGNDEKKPPPFVAAAPYRQLMEPFFPPSNLLLADGCPHAKMRGSWEGGARRLLGDECKSNLLATSIKFLKQLPNDTAFDLYAHLKTLAWQLFLGTFLDMSPSDPGYAEYVQLQENLLRGQFSLMPISISVGFYSSPRHVGISARKKLQRIISIRVDKAMPTWIDEDVRRNRPREEIVNHILMATSSLAVKGFASLLMAFLLNVFVSDKPLWKWMEGDTAKEKHAKQEAVLTETMRLSPPICGVMRRSTEERALTSRNQQEPDILVRKGWDVWTYFPGGNRDKSVFGEDADLFVPHRYLDESKPPPPIAFGLGPKQCLGGQFTPMAAKAVLDAFQETGNILEGNVQSVGVRGWLGCQLARSEEWAADVKQLPTQHPSKAIMVRLKPRS